MSDPTPGGQANLPACSADSVDGYLARLASGAPAPGGGSAAALHVAQGAALLAMVAHLTVGRPRFRQQEDEVRAILAEVEQLRARATAAIDDDAAALGAMIATYKLPRATPDERAARDSALQAAFAAAMRPPLAVLRAAVTLLPLCERLLPLGNPAAVSDIGVAAASARAGFDSAELNVLINLAQLHDDQTVAAIRAELVAARPPLEETTAHVLDAVRAQLR